jgi:predicted nucleic acid-binding protein
LVAYLDRSDHHHAWAREVMGTLTEPVVTCDAVLAEVAFLLQRGGIAAGLLLRTIERGVLVSRFESMREAQSLRVLLERYENVPMSFADACMVRLSELHPRAEVWTTDSDFTIYRRNRRSPNPAAHAVTDSGMARAGVKGGRR